MLQLSDNCLCPRRQKTASFSLYLWILIFYFKKCLIWRSNVFTHACLSSFSHYQSGRSRSYGCSWTWGGSGTPWRVWYTWIAWTLRSLCKWSSHHLWHWANYEFSLLSWIFALARRAEGWKCFGKTDLDLLCFMLCVGKPWYWRNTRS